MTIGIADIGDLATGIARGHGGQLRGFVEVIDKGAKWVEGVG